MTININSFVVRLLANAFVRSCDAESYNFIKPLYIFLFSLLIAVISYQSSLGQAELIKDLNTISSENYLTDHSLTHGGDRMYYVDNNQLWMSNGTPAATSVLKAFKSISNLMPIGRRLYFTADDGISGEELWSTDGTVVGTAQIKDINPGLVSSSPSAVCIVMGRMFFSAKHDGFGRELWVTDGTTEGTVMVRDIRKGRGNSNPGALTQMNGMVYFSANDGNRGFELWTSDGTAAGTHIVRDIVSAYRLGSNPKWLTNINDVLYFTASHANTGLELWKTNGTSAGTVRVKDIRSGAQGSGVRNLINVKGTLFFTANDGVHGHELWKSNGSAESTVLVRDANPGAGGINSGAIEGPAMRAFTDINGILYFVAGKGQQDFLYRSDGTTAGTFSIQTSFPTSSSPIMPAFTYLNGRVYFFNSQERETPYYLHSMDYNGRAPEIVAQFTPADNDYDPFHQEMISFQGALYTFGRLMTSDWAQSPFKFIKSDGTSNGTVAINDVHPVATLGSNPFHMVRTTDLLYIQTSAQTSQSRRFDLYRSDGSTDGTFRITELQEGDEMVASGNRLFFGTRDEFGGILWVTEGTPESTMRLTSPHGMSLGRASLLTEVNGVVYFADNYIWEGNPYSIFWKSDGTPDGTRMLQGTTRVHSITRVAGKVIAISELQNGDLFMFKTTKTRTAWVATIPWGGSRRPAYQPTAVIDLVMYFVAADGEERSNEIWRTDGTPAGTYMLFDFNTDDPINQQGVEDDIRALIAVKKSLYFNAKSTDGQWGLYKYVAPASYEKIADMPPLVHSFVVNRMMYLFTESEHPGTLNVWASDGTSTGTTFLTPISAYQTIDHAVVDGITYFSSPESQQMFRSDGTPCGTSEVNTGFDRAFPVEALGTSIVFGAYSPQTGLEPYIYRDISSAPAPVCNDTMDAKMSSETTVFTAYPNPFADEFALRVNGVDNTAVHINVKTLQGLNVETLTGLKTNIHYEHIGGTWPKGVLVVTVLVNNRSTSHLIIKK